MIQAESTRMGATALVGSLARTVQGMVTQPGDQQTEIPDLTLHRRNGPTEPMHCVYTLGLAVTVQGGKDVLLGGEADCVWSGAITTGDNRSAGFVSHYEGNAARAVPGSDAQVRQERNRGSGFGGGVAAATQGRSV